MRLVIICFSLLFSICQVYPTLAQEPVENDPKATRILDDLREKYESAKGLKIEFTLHLEYPEQPVQTLEGELSQKGEKYRLDLGDQLFISNGEDLWLYQKELNEVQINNIDPDAEGFNSPSDFLTVYENTNFRYILLKEEKGAESPVYQIDFKPLDPDESYFKIRLRIDKKTLSIKRVKVFEKDGSRYTIHVQKLETNTSFPEGLFTFDKSKYPDVYIEDLRID